MPSLTWLRWLASVATYCQLGRKANACGEGSAGCHPDECSETPLREAGTEAWMSINRTTAQSTTSYKDHSYAVLYRSIELCNAVEVGEHALSSQARSF